MAQVWETNTFQRDIIDMKFRNSWNYFVPGSVYSEYDEYFYSTYSKCVALFYFYVSWLLHITQQLLPSEQEAEFIQ